MSGGASGVAPCLAKLLSPTVGFGPVRATLPRSGLPISSEIALVTWDHRVA